MALAVNSMVMAIGLLPVVATSIATGEVRRFRSYTEAQQILGLNKNAIRRCISGERTHSGGWKFTQETTPPRHHADEWVTFSVSITDGGWTGSLEEWQARRKPTIGEQLDAVLAGSP